MKHPASATTIRAGFSEPALPKTPGLKALLIESDPADAQIIQKVLSGSRDPRFEVETADCLSTALDRLTHEKMDVVLLDLALPDTAGLGAVLKVIQKTPHIPIIALAGKNQEAVAMEALSLGVQDYLVKDPEEFKSLPGMVQKAFRRQLFKSSFAAIVHNSAIGILVLDGNGHILFANPEVEAIFGRRAQDLTGQPFGYPFTIGKRTEIELRHQGKGPLVFEASTTETTWNKEKAFLITLQDITERRKQEKLKDTFISVASHELRTPLTAISIGVEMLHEELSGSLAQHQREMLDIAMKNSEYLTQIIDNLLDLARLQPGRKPNFCKLDIPPLLQGVLQNTYPVAKQKNLELMARFPQETLYVYADPEMLVRVANNLLSNALRFARKELSVQIQALSTDEIQVTVADDGIGIPPDRIPTLFAEFSQAHPPTKSPDRYKGTGLGLALCKGIIEAHGGRIWMEGAPGTGTRFHFTLLRYRDEVRFKLEWQRFQNEFKEKGSPFVFVTICPQKLGNPARMQLFQKIENRIQSSLLRQSDSLHRYEPKGCLVILAKTDRTGAQIIKNRLQQQITEECVTLGEGRQAGSDFVIGTAVYPQQGTEPEKLIEAALGDRG